MKENESVYTPFIRAIRATPDDDNVRLVYADFLDEQGEGERATFIRLSIELAHLGDSCSNPDPWERWCARCAWCELHAKCASLLTSLHPPGSVGCVMKERPPAELDEVTCLYWRGFVHAIDCTMREWYEKGAWLLSQHLLAKPTLWDAREPICGRDGDWWWPHFFDESAYPEGFYESAEKARAAMVELALQDARRYVSRYDS